MLSPRIYLAALPFLFLACFAGSCDHTLLSGSVRAPAELRVGRPAPLSLEVAQGLEGIYWEHWRVDPPDAGRFEPEEDQGRQVDRKSVV